MEFNKNYVRAILAERKKNKDFDETLNSPNKQIRARAYKVFRKKFIGGHERKWHKRRVALFSGAITLGLSAFVAGCKIDEGFFIPAVIAGGGGLHGLLHEKYPSYRDGDLFDMEIKGIARDNKELEKRAADCLPPAKIK